MRHGFLLMYKDLFGTDAVYEEWDEAGNCFFGLWETECVKRLNRGAMELRRCGLFLHCLDF